MATFTAKLKLSKPDYNDVRDIKVLNNNADLIDKFAVDVEKLVNDNKSFNDGKFESLLLETSIKGTRQVVTKDANGKISKIEHKNGDVVIRRDSFSYGANEIVEARLLVSSNKSLTFNYNLVTLEVAVV